MNILVVDDEQSLQEMYTEFFKHFGPDATVVTAKDGVEAFYKCAIEKFDLILLDYRMPRMDGVSFLGALRSGGLNEKTSVIVSSGILPEFDLSPKELPNTYFLQKPMNFKKLTDLLHSIL